MKPREKKAIPYKSNNGNSKVEAVMDGVVIDLISSSSDDDSFRNSDDNEDWKGQRSRRRRRRSSESASTKGTKMGSKPTVDNRHSTSKYKRVAMANHVVVPPCDMDNSNGNKRCRDFLSNGNNSICRGALELEDGGKNRRTSARNLLEQQERPHQKQKQYQHQQQQKLHHRHQEEHFRDVAVMLDDKDGSDNAIITYGIFSLLDQLLVDGNSNAATCTLRNPIRNDCNNFVLSPRVGTSTPTTTSTTTARKRKKISSTLQHIQQNDKWSCGFRNLQMMLTALLPHLPHHHAYFQQNQEWQVQQKLQHHHYHQQQRCHQQQQHRQQRRIRDMKKNIKDSVVRPGFKKNRRFTTEKKEENNHLHLHQSSSLLSYFSSSTESLSSSPPTPPTPPLSSSSDSDDNNSTHASGILSCKIPSLKQLQQKLEDSWAAGFDPRGAQHYKYKVVGTPSKIGAVEVSSVMSYWGLDSTVVQFIKCSESRQLLPRFIWCYFHQKDKTVSTTTTTAAIPNNATSSMSCCFCNSNYNDGTLTVSGNGASSLSRAKDIMELASSTRSLSSPLAAQAGGGSSCDCPLLPLYLQWEGHSVTVVGVELAAAASPAKLHTNNNLSKSSDTKVLNNNINNVNLLILDPCRDGEKLKMNLHRNKSLSCIRLNCRKLREKDCQVIMCSMKSLTSYEKQLRRDRVHAVTAAQEAVLRAARNEYSADR